MRKIKGWKQVKEEKSRLTDFEKQMQFIFFGFDLLEKQLTNYERTIQCQKEQ